MRSAQPAERVLDDLGRGFARLVRAGRRRVRDPAGGVDVQEEAGLFGDGRARELAGVDLGREHRRTARAADGELVDKI